MSKLTISRRTVLGGAAAIGATSFSILPARAGALDKVKQAGEFKFGLEVGYKPFEFRDDSGNLAGYDIDIANEVGKRLGVKATAVDTNWSTVIQTLYDGGFDLILGGMTATEKRFKRVNFSIPYMDASSGLLVKSDSGITDRKGLAGKAVSAGAGTPQINQLKLSAEELGISYDGDIKTYDSDAVAYEAMRAGRIAGYASTMVSLLEFTKATDGFTVLPFTSSKWSQEWTCMAFRKEDDDLRGAFNDALTAMKGDGTMKALQEKWFGRSFVDSLASEPPTW